MESNEKTISNKANRKVREVNKRKPWSWIIKYGFLRGLAFGLRSFRGEIDRKAAFMNSLLRRNFILLTLSVYLIQLV